MTADGYRRIFAVMTQRDCSEVFRLLNLVDIVLTITRMTDLGSHDIT